MKQLFYKNSLYKNSNRQVQADATLSIPFAGLSAPLIYVGEILSETLFAALDGVKNLLADWQRQRAIEQNIALLSSLQDHILDDIGIKRYQIREAAEFIVDHCPGDRYRYLTQ